MCGKRGGGNAESWPDTEPESDMLPDSDTARGTASIEDNIYEIVVAGAERVALVESRVQHVTAVRPSRSVVVVGDGDERG